MLAGFDILIVDNFCNSKATVLERIEQIVGRRPELVEADIRDRKAMQALFAINRFDAVIHFAGLKSVGESVASHCVITTIISMAASCCLKRWRCRVKTLVFSSSATVYGDPHAVPILEDFPLSATNPYGRSKLYIEIYCGHRACRRFMAHRIIALFQSGGAHESGLIGRILMEFLII